MKGRTSPMAEIAKSEIGPRGEAVDPQPRAEWQKCPVCGGTRMVPHGFFSHMTMATGTELERCLVCNGTGMVPYPDYGQPDAKSQVSQGVDLALWIRQRRESLDMEATGRAAMDSTR